MRIALVGTRGVPARYGGFETCVEEVGVRLVEAGHEVVVYCRIPEGGSRDAAPTEHRGMRLVHLPALRHKVLETLSHTLMSVLHLLFHRADAVVVFNSANAVFLPLLRAFRMPVATHVDGLEWKRAKWQGAGRRFYRIAESLAVRWSDRLIADAQGIADYYAAEFGADTDLIAYGAPIVVDDRPELLDQYGLVPRGYHLVVARFEPENQVDVIVDGYRRSSARLPLVVVGSAPYADEYTARVRALADDRVIFVGSVWDQDALDQLYANCATYLHGHSVGGTNPSLLRAVGAGAAVLAFDVVFNREVLAESGRYFTDADGVCAELLRAESRPNLTLERGRLARRIAAHYDWSEVATAYEVLCKNLVAGYSSATRRPSGRRNGITSIRDSVVWNVPAMPRSAANTHTDTQTGTPAAAAPAAVAAPTRSRTTFGAVRVVRSARIVRVTRSGATHRSSPTANAADRADRRRTVARRSLAGAGLGLMLALIVTMLSGCTSSATRHSAVVRSAVAPSSASSASPTAAPSSSSAPASGSPTLGPSVRSSVHPGPTTKVPPPTPGNITATVPARRVLTRSAVALTAPASFDRTMRAAISVRRITATARIPGEVSGPALAVTLTLRNTSRHRVDISATQVAVSDSSGTPLVLQESASHRVPHMLAAGTQVTGTYVFHLRGIIRGPIHVVAGYAGAAPLVEFVGRI